jgi:hypothetical protein
MSLSKRNLFQDIIVQVGQGACIHIPSSVCSAEPGCSMHAVVVVLQECFCVTAVTLCVFLALSLRARRPVQCTGWYDLHGVAAVSGERMPCCSGTNILKLNMTYRIRLPLLGHTCKLIC